MGEEWTAPLTKQKMTRVKKIVEILAEKLEFHFIYNVDDETAGEVIPHQTQAEPG